MIQIKKVILIALVALTCSIVFFSQKCYSGDVNSYTLKTGISIVEQVPGNFYGTWRVIAKLDETTNSQKFKPTSVDLWNLSREGDVINLSNPFTGANASITVSYVGDNVIKFTKIGDYEGYRLTDTVEIKLNGSKFSGINRLSLETLSDVDGHVVKTDKATYNLQGERISADVNTSMVRQTLLCRTVDNPRQRISGESIR